MAIFGVANDLDKEIDSDTKSVNEHLGPIADSMAVWDGCITDKLGLKASDIADIKLKCSGLKERW